MKNKVLSRSENICSIMYKLPLLFPGAKASIIISFLEESRFSN